MKTFTWVAYNALRNEWIDNQGVGHYDASNEFTTHGCNGACWQDDFPGHNKTRVEALKKAKSLGLYSDARQ